MMQLAALRPEALQLGPQLCLPRLGGLGALGLRLGAQGLHFCPATRRPGPWCGS